jgi:hypothetical protein
MGRFTSVQAFTDNNASTRTITYAQATGGTTGAASVKAATVKPEKVVNPYSSTAGAGSGDFHVYRASRAREMERLERLENEYQAGAKELEYQQLLERNRATDEERTAKRRKKRTRQKEAKLRKNCLKKAGIIATSVASETTGLPSRDDEFRYDRDAPPPEADDKDTSKEDRAAPPIAFPNDGSFLEQMKKRLSEEQGKSDHDTSDDEAPRPVKRKVT